MLETLAASLLGADVGAADVAQAPTWMAILIWLIPLCPLAASIVTAIAGPIRLREKSHLPCIAGCAASAACAVLLWLLGGVGSAPRVVAGYEWMQIGGVTIDVTLRADALSAMMLATVTFVSTLVAVYSAGYMHHDPGYVRYFSVFALFVFSMTMLVLANNFVLLYVFWEAVGLCSYLLIGFWFHRPSAAAAARKAFLVNRIGDLGFALGIFLLWRTLGASLSWTATGGDLLDYQVVFAHAATLAAEHPGAVTLICLLLFVGAVGKSAQFPLHVWLPDAMEGPSPVSALIHAATMVTAGVYMVARCTPLFIHAPAAQVVVACTGAFMALLAALIAITQFDLKRVLAYSTVSQLGLMFLALGSGVAGEQYVGLAVVAATFHLFTHAFFKALLFLGAGSVMHAMGDVIDMRRFGGLRHALPVTHRTFLCGALALAGFPLFAGFWSKDEILLSTWNAARYSAYPTTFHILLDSALLTSLLTAFYTFRAYFMTFWGEERFPEWAGAHPHDAPDLMAMPLRILAWFAIFVGLIFGPTHWFAHYVERTPGLPHGHASAVSGSIMLAGSACAVLGILFAWLLYRRHTEVPAAIEARMPIAAQASQQRFYFDEIYYAFLVAPLERLAQALRSLDLRLLDGLVDIVGPVPGRIGRGLRRVQNGLVQNYALAMVLGLSLLTAYLLHGLP